MPCWCNGKCPHAGAPAALLKQGKEGRAAWALRTALTAAPFCPEANLMLAAILSRKNRAKAAAVHITRAAKYGDPTRVAYEGAFSLRLQLRLDEAARAFHDAIAENPDMPLLAASYIDTLEVAGALEEAKRLADAARERFPADASVRRAAAIVAASLGDYAGAVEIISSPGDDLLPIEFLDRGRYLDHLGEHGRAWADWMAGKQFAREKLNHHYRAEYFTRHFGELREAATPRRREFMLGAAPVTDGGPTPIFVCGFPRSGTTLAETILSAHSGIVAGDELMGITDVIEALPAWCKVRAPYPAALIATSLGENSHVPDMLRDLYLTTSRRRIGWEKKRGRAAPKFFTDKMCLNEIHLPLIRLLFPAAPVFRMERHPLDVMVSCMSHWLPHGGFYASSLEDCARHFVAVDGLWRSYQETMPGGPGVAVPVSYESLVATPETEIPAMLALAGLKAESRTLTPHKNPRTSATLSYKQVRQPINAGSVGRWKPYRAQLAPAVEILRPILERDGYDY